MKQIIFHYIILNYTFQFLHYNMPAFTRRPVSAYAKARLSEAYTNGEDFVEIARILKVNRVTAYTIIARLNRESSMSHGGHRYQKVDDEMRACAVDVISENPLYTLKQINEELQRRLPEKPEISLKTLSNCLEGMAYTLKLSRDVPSDRNRMDVKTERQNYANWLMSEEVVNSLKVFVDEFGVNIHTKRSFGRSTRGTRTYRTVSRQAGANVTVCLGVCATYGLVFHEIYRGGMTMVRFSSFLELCCGNLIAENAAHRLGYVIFDNAPAHRNVENIDAELLNLKRLPKYSPFLNPAENAISCWKAEFKKQISQRQREFIDISDEMRNGRTLNDYRFEKIRDILEISKGVITPEKCRAWENNVLTYLPRCLAFDNIEG